jgi:hypothetical protein
MQESTTDMQDGFAHNLLETRFTLDSFKTWQTMSEENHESLIVSSHQAWPDEDFRIDVALGAVSEEIASAYAKEFLLPYLDSKAMAQNSQIIFRMIYLHTRRPPGNCITFEAKQLQQGYELGAMGQEELQGCVRIADVTAGCLLWSSFASLPCIACS